MDKKSRMQSTAEVVSTSDSRKARPTTPKSTPLFSSKEASRIPMFTISMPTSRLSLIFRKSAKRQE